MADPRWDAFHLQLNKELDMIMTNETQKPASSVTTATKPATPAPTNGQNADRNRLDAAERNAAARHAEERNSNTPRERDDPMAFSGLKLNLRWSTKGWHPYWENDEAGAIEQLLYEGFQFADPAEVHMTSAIVSDSDLGNRVSRYVGKQADGSPLRAYLMKCPDDLWARREQARYRQADEWDSAIKAGTIQHGDGRYKPKGTDINLNTQFSKEY